MSALVKEEARTYTGTREEHVVLVGVGKEARTYTGVRKELTHVRLATL